MSNTTKERDRILRSFITAKTWDKNPEFRIKRAFVARQGTDAASPFERDFHTRFPYLYDDEWEVVPGRMNEGRGDLLFASADSGLPDFAVLEIKFIDFARCGSTARAARTNARGKVVDQARDYAMKASLRHPGATVTAFALTNESVSEVCAYVRGVEVSAR